jgi:hypothetical protein
MSVTGIEIPRFQKWDLANPEIGCLHAELTKRTAFTPIPTTMSKITIGMTAKYSMLGGRQSRPETNSRVFVRPCVVVDPTHERMPGRDRPPNFLTADKPPRTLSMSASPCWQQFTLEVQRTLADF